MYITYVCTYICMFVHINIGMYILSEGSEYPSEIFWEIFWYKKFCGKINRDHAACALASSFEVMVSANGMTSEIGFSVPTISIPGC